MSYQLSDYMANPAFNVPLKQQMPGSTDGQNTILKIQFFYFENTK